MVSAPIRALFVAVGVLRKHKGLVELGIADVELVVVGISGNTEAVPQAIGGS